MLTQIATALVVSLAAVSPYVADESKVIALEIKGLPFAPNRGKIQAPLVITDQRGLEGAWPKDKYPKIQEKILGQVDFKKQQLMYFAWSGSSGDELTFQVEGDKATTIVFAYKPGADADIVPHFRLYAVPRDWKHRMK